jgi:hypothetical protein
MAIRLLLVAATVVALAGCGGDEEAAAPPQAPASAPSSAPVLAASYDPDGSRIVWVDGRTLEPVDDRSVPVPFFTAVAALSADGATLAVGESEGGAVQLVDVARMRALGTIEVTPGAWVERLHWARPDLLLASLGGSTSRVAALDPATLEVLSVRELGGVTLYSQPSWVTFRGGALLASAWTEGTDEQTLIVFGPDGELRFSLVRESADFSQVSGRHLYAARGDGTRFEIVDLETGATVGTAEPPLETWILSAGS